MKKLFTLLALCIFLSACSQTIIVETSEPKIPENCESWFDGCNNCMVGENGMLGCTRMFCPEEAMRKPKCTKFKEEAVIPEEDMLICTMEYAPVCGKDGKTYGNKCSARKTEIAYEGKCKKEIKIPDIAKKNLDDHGNKVEHNCSVWYDGCNQCSVEEGELSCTERKCVHQETPKCLKFKEFLNVPENCEGEIIMSEHGFEMCVTETSDAGKECTTSSECESFCMASDSLDIPKRGTCYGETPFMGCLDTFENGQIATVCS